MRTPPCGPTVYLANGPLLRGRIVAADVLGGSFDVLPEDDLTDLESDALTLRALGYSNAQAASLSGRSIASHDNYFQRALAALECSEDDPVQAIAESFDMGIFRVTRPISLARFGVQSPDQLPRSAAGFLMHKMTAHFPHAVAFEVDDVVHDEHRIVSIAAWGGAVALRTQAFLNVDESNVFSYRLTGNNLQRTRLLMSTLTDRRWSDDAINKTIASVYAKYDVKTMPAALTVAARMGHLILDRESVAPENDLTNQQEKIWPMLAHGCSRKDMSHELGMSLTNTNFHSAQLLTALGVQNLVAASLRYYMSYPTAAMLPIDHTYNIRANGGTQLPSPATYMPGAVKKSS